MLPRRETSRVDSGHVINVLSAESFARFKELFQIEITPEELKAFAEANKSFEDVISLAEHICLVLIEAVQNRQASIFGMRDEVRAKLAQVVKLTESTAFDDLLYIPQKQRDQRLFGLAVQFLNENF